MFLELLQCPFVIHSRQMHIYGREWAWKLEVTSGPRLLLLTNVIKGKHYLL